MEKYLPILRSSPFFKGLNDNEILSILHCVNATVISKERDSYIFRAGGGAGLVFVCRLPAAALGICGGCAAGLLIRIL